MRVHNPQTGKSYYEKRRRRYNAPGQPREVTFSCCRRYPFMVRPRACEWFCEALDNARTRFGFQLWAYVLMPEHVHLLVNPGDAAEQIPSFLQAVKEPVSRKAIQYLKINSPEWLEKITIKEGKRIRHRFWQPGGGYDRNIAEIGTLRAMIDYIHANPVRRGLVKSIEDWEWSSARWFAGERPVKLEMDARVLAELAGG